MSTGQIDAMFTHAIQVSPEECCGIIIGRTEAAGSTALNVHPVANVHPDDRSRRYEVDPRAQLSLQRECRRNGCEIIGYYHSHPFGSACPSRWDEQSAWPGWSYVILSLKDGTPDEARSWQFDARSRRFTEEPIVVL